jgi:Fe2+ or Zn2+ uptake regulation protein
MPNPTLQYRVISEAMKHPKSFSVMEVLFALNKQHPMVGLQQVHHTLDTLARQGTFVKISAGRYQWGR